VVEEESMNTAFIVIAKNRWGINLATVSCPRCNLPLPQIRQPQNIQQALWGGGTCTICGAEIDKWGREVIAPRHKHSSGGMSTRGGRMQSALKMRLIIFSAAGYFCLTILFDWLEMSGDSTTLRGWMVFVVTAAVETAIFSGLFYLVSMYVLNRFFFKRRGS
jgi:hypothetical protein